MQFISAVCQEVHERAIQAMAEFTANSIEHFHRAGQLILQDKTIPVTLYPSMAISLSRYVLPHGAFGVMDAVWGIWGNGCCLGYWGYGCCPRAFGVMDAVQSIWVNE